MTKFTELSQQDKHILALLEQSGRMSFAELALEVGLSKTPCWNRVQSLSKQGIVEGYYAKLNAQRLGLEIRAFVHVTIDFSQAEAFESAIVEHPNILRCEAVTGDFDYLLELVASSMNDLDLLLRKELSGIAGITRFSTSISTREIKHTNALMPVVK